MKNIGFLLVAFFLINSLYGQVLLRDQITDKKNGANAKGSFRLYKKSDQLKLDVKFRVKKKDGSGTGKGVYRLAILNEKFEPVYKITKKLTVDSRGPDGVNERRWAESLSFSGKLAEKIQTQGLIIAFSVDMNDKTRIPANREEWKKALKAEIEYLNDLMDMTIGEEMRRGVWKFLMLSLI